MRDPRVLATSRPSRRGSLRLLSAALALFGWVGAAAYFPATAEVLLDDVVQAGEYLFLRDSTNEHGYHYAPANLRLAPDVEGKPQFLFVKYTRAREDESSGSLQGGLLHALLTWGFDATEISRARSALRQVDPEGELLGPVPIRDGHISVVSAAATEDSFVRQIVGTGRCAVLPGGRCAVGIALTPEGATLLWETLQRDTSDVAVAFLVKFKGLTPAFRARLVVDWDKVYSQHDIQHGATVEYYKVRGNVEVAAVIDSLRESGAIEVIVDGEDTEMQRLWETVYGHLTALMFEAKVGAPQPPKKTGGGPSPISQIADATRKVLLPRPCDGKGATGGNRPTKPKIGRTLSGRGGGSGRGLANGLALLSDLPGAGMLAAAQERSEGQEPPEEEKAKPEKSAWPGGMKTGRQLQRKRKPPAATAPKVEPATPERKPSPPEEAGEPAPCPGDPDQERKESGLLGAEITISYSYRREKRSGHYEVDFRKRMREERELVVTQNLGGFIQSEADAARYLVEVNLDDPFFEDRPVDVLLDGQDHADFAQFVNAVDVQLRRSHQDGSATEKSVVFTEEELARRGNRRRWTYPRLGDDPQEWLDYSYKVDWHFDGGATALGSWRDSDASVVTLSPPARYRTIRVSASQDDLDAHGVLAVSVQVRSRLFGESRERELVIVADRGDPLAADYRFLQEPDDPSYEVKVVWVTRDGREVVESWSRREAGFVVLRFPEARS
jgi:hypothetical protein